MSQLCGSGLRRRSKVTSAACADEVPASSAAAKAAADFMFILFTHCGLSSPRKRGPTVPRTRASGILDPRLRGDDSTAVLQPEDEQHGGVRQRLHLGRARELGARDAADAGG